MKVEPRACQWCGEEINSGRSDKKYCDKSCSNSYNNYSFKRRNIHIDRYMKTYRKSYMALERLVDKYGIDSEIHVNDAIVLGFNTKTPCFLLRLKGRKGTYNQIGNLVYQVSKDYRFIKIYKLND